jgi:hypothetical protein
MWLQLQGWLQEQRSTLPMRRQQVAQDQRKRKSMQRMQEQTLPEQ